MQDKAGFKLVDKPRSFYYQDPTLPALGEDGSRFISPDDDAELCIRLSDLGAGWSTKSRRTGHTLTQVIYTVKINFKLMENDNISIIVSINLNEKYQYIYTTSCNKRGWKF